MSDPHESWWPLEGCGPWSDTVPADPRRIDPLLAAQLRDLFVEANWCGEGADLAILRAVFCARHDARRIAVPVWQSFQAEPRAGPGSAPPRHYVSTAFVTPRAYTASIDATVGLLSQTLPGYGFVLACHPGRRVRANLVKGREAGAVFDARSAPLALLAALFDELAIDPGAAAARREP